MQLRHWCPGATELDELTFCSFGYRFFDFLRVGGPLTLLYWFVCTMMIPILFPF